MAEWRGSTHKLGFYDRKGNVFFTIYWYFIDRSNSFCVPMKHVGNVHSVVLCSASPAYIHVFVFAEKVRMRDVDAFPARTSACWGRSAQKSFKSHLGFSMGSLFTSPMINQSRNSIPRSIMFKWIIHKASEGAQWNGTDLMHCQETRIQSVQNKTRWDQNV